MDFRLDGCVDDTKSLSPLFFFFFLVLINTVILKQLKGNKANPLRKSAHTIKIQQKLNIQRGNIKKHKI